MVSGRAVGQLRGQVAFVSGGGRGIGRAIALALANEGASVAAAARTRAEIETVAAECRRIGVDAEAIELDVSDRAACDKAIHRCLERFGRIDILVNNAGIASSSKFVDISDDDWERVLRINLTGAFHLTRAVLPHMLERGSGRVIAIDSVAGKQGAAYIAPYAAAKHGLLGMMRSLAVEYARTGITFNAVCPAYVDTPLTEDAVRVIMEKTGRTRERALQALYTPQGRLVKPDEVAAVCLLLASPHGAGINGQAINVDGGEVQS